MFDINLYNSFIEAQRFKYNKIKLKIFILILVVTIFSYNYVLIKKYFSKKDMITKCINKIKILENEINVNQNEIKRSNSADFVEKFKNLQVINEATWSVLYIMPELISYNIMLHYFEFDKQFKFSLYAESIELFTSIILALKYSNLVKKIQVIDLIKINKNENNLYKLSLKLSIYGN